MAAGVSVCHASDKIIALCVAQRRRKLNGPKLYESYLTAAVHSLLLSGLFDSQLSVVAKSDGHHFVPIKPCICFFFQMLSLHLRIVRFDRVGVSIIWGAVPVGCSDSFYCCDCTKDTPSPLVTWCFSRHHHRFACTARATYRTRTHTPTHTTRRI